MEKIDEHVTRDLATMDIRDQKGLASDRGERRRIVGEAKAHQELQTQRNNNNKKKKNRKLNAVLQRRYVWYELNYSHKHNKPLSPVQRIDYDAYECKDCKKFDISQAINNLKNISLDIQQCKHLKNLREICQ